MVERRKWSREETILALYLYYQIPFGKIHATYPDIIYLAKLIGRTPSAVCMKMCNLARFDETLKQRKVSGLNNGSKLDEIIWYEFVNDIDKLIHISTEILQESTKEKSFILVEKVSDDICDTYFKNINKERTVFSKVRVGQDFFRKAVLSAYNNRCCISNIHFSELLIASHIKPWSESNDENEKVNPRNGLCLNAFYDKAFDRGYITISDKYIVHVSKQIREDYKDKSTKEWFGRCEGKKIILPDRFKPDKKFIQYHNDVVFKG